jgi:hypothetical protein
MHRHSTRRVTLLLSATLYSASPASAQMFDGFAAQMAMTTMHNSVLQRSITGPIKPPATVQPNPEPSRSTANLNYVASRSRRIENLANFVDRLRAADPVGAAELAKLFASTDIIEAAASGLAQYGLRTDNVADAYTVWWINSWQAAHGDTSDASRAKAQAVKRQVTSVLLTIPAMQRMNDAAKQEMAESMIVQAMLFSNFVETFKSDPAKLQQLGAAVRQGAMKSGLISMR